jgi:maltose O-acetyltransferase
MISSALRPRAALVALQEFATTAASFARAAYQLRGTERGARIRSYGWVDVERRGRIAIGQRVTFLSGPVATLLRCQRGAALTIGDRTICNYGATVDASDRIRIGSDCMIASYVHICDSDGRRSGSVTVGDGVWLAHGVVVEPGAVIGDGSVVAALTVVSGVVPPRSLVAGNPAQTVPLEVPSAGWPQRLGPSGAGAGPPTPADVRTAIIEWLDDTRCFGDAATRISGDSTSLRDAGLLDSLGLVQLVAMLEKRFGTTVDRERASRPESQSIRGLFQCLGARPDERRQ